MSSRDRSSSSSGQQSSQEDRQVSAKSKDDVINAAFNPETRSKIANITKRSQPSKLVDEVRGEGEHPLLYLHQSVSGDKNHERKNGGDGGKDKSQRQGEQLQQKQTQQQPPVKVANETTKLKDTSNLATETKAQSSNNTIKPTTATSVKEKTQTTRSASNKQTKSSAFATFFKSIAILSLLFLWIAILHTAIVNNSSAQTSDRDGTTTNILSELSTVLTATKSGINSFIQQVKPKVQSALQSVHTVVPSVLSLLATKKEISIEQLDKRITMGFNLLSGYNDVAGSISACEGVLFGLLRKGKAMGSDGLDFKMISSSISRLSADESQELSRALLCVGEARLASFSSTFGSDEMKRDELTKAKESLESAVSDLYVSSFTSPI